MGHRETQLWSKAKARNKGNGYGRKTQELGETLLNFGCMYP